MIISSFSCLFGKSMNKLKKIFTIFGTNWCAIFGLFWMKSILGSEIYFYYYKLMSEKVDAKNDFFLSQKITQVLKKYKFA